MNNSDTGNSEEQDIAAAFGNPTEDSIAELIKRSQADPATPFEEEPIALLRQLRSHDMAGWQRVRLALKDAKVRIGDLDAATTPTPKGNDDDDQDNQIIEQLEPWPSPVSGPYLAGDIRKHIKRYVTFQDQGDSIALTLWVMGTYSMDVWRLWPKVHISSPAKRCGKSTLCEALEALCYRSFLVANVSTSAIFRIVEKYGPTFIIDEADTFLAENREAAGILNSGHTRRTAYVVRVEGDDHEPTKFSTWGPQVIAGIGDMADTLMDRSISINLRRQLPREKKPKLPGDLFDQSVDLRRKLVRWANDNKISLANSGAMAGECGNDRAQDNWTPLFKIADVIGKSEAVRSAYVQKESAGNEGDQDDATLMMLEDVHSIVEASGDTAIASEDLVSQLLLVPDRPWPEWRNGALPISKAGVAKLLKAVGLRPAVYKDGKKARRGYRKEKIKDAFDRYSPSFSANTSAATVTPQPLYENNGLEENWTVTNGEWFRPEKSSNLLTNIDSYEVTVAEGGTAKREGIAGAYKDWSEADDWA